MQFNCKLLKRFGESVIYEYKCSLNTENHFAAIYQFWIFIYLLSSWLVVLRNQTTFNSKLGKASIPEFPLLNKSNAIQIETPCQQDTIKFLWSLITTALLWVDRMHWKSSGEMKWKSVPIELDTIHEMQTTALQSWRSSLKAPWGSNHVYATIIRDTLVCFVYGKCE